MKRLTPSMCQELDRGKGLVHGDAPDTALIALRFAGFCLPAQHTPAILRSTSITERRKYYMRADIRPLSSLSDDMPNARNAIHRSTKIHFFPEHWSNATITVDRNYVLHEVVKDGWHRVSHCSGVVISDDNG
jgi:hypothetical protein